MRNLYLDPITYDLAVGLDFNLRFTTTLAEYVSQKIENALSTFKDEWFLDRSLGIPYFDRILIKGADLDDVNNIFLSVITNIPEVDEVLEFETNYDGTIRKYTVNFAVLASEQVITGTVEI